MIMELGEDGFAEYTSSNALKPGSVWSRSFPEYIESWPPETGVSTSKEVLSTNT